MAGSRLLLDTSVVIDILRGATNVKLVIEKALQTAIPSVVIGELFYGAFNSSFTEKHLAQINDIL